MSKHNTTTTTVPSDMTSTDHELLCLDMRAEYPSDRAHFPSRLSNELRDQILHYGSWRPKRSFPVSEEFWRRKFSENHYHVKSASGCIKIERLWLCFSLYMSKPYCQNCWLFGDHSLLQIRRTEGVMRNPKNYGDKTKSHEKTTVHRVACSLLHSGRHSSK